MAVELGYTVLPVSALKAQAKVVFEALKKGQTVFVANRGRVVAAFRPYTSVPDAVAALHASPYLDLPTVTARHLERAPGASRVVTEAAKGLPSIVENDRRIYGILTSATTPEPSQIPDPDAVGARAEAVRKYREDNPDATIDQIMEYSNSLEDSPQDVGSWTEWPLSDQLVLAPLEDDAAIHGDLELWRDQGSSVEDVVQEVFTSLDAAIPAAAKGNGIARHVPTLPELVVGSLRANAAMAGRRIIVLSGERLEADGETVQARTRYVTALTAGQHPNVGAMWRLGNLARSSEHYAEAARWFRLSLAINALEQT